MYRGIYTQGQETLYTLCNQSAQARDWEVVANQSWLQLTSSTGELSGTLEGVGGPDDCVDTTVGTRSEIDDLGPGEHVAVAVFKDLETGRTAQRDVRIDVGWPIEVQVDATPVEFSGIYGGPFDQPSELRTLTLVSLVDFDLEYEVTWEGDWLEVTSSHDFSGTLAAGVALAFDVAVAAEADALDVGDYTEKVSFRFTDSQNNNLSDVLDEKITLHVEDPIAIAPADDWNVELEGETLPLEVYSLDNRDEAVAIDVELAVNVDWLAVDESTVSVLPETIEQIAVRITEAARSLGNGTYEGTVHFLDTFTGHEQTRRVNLTINDELTVGPKSGLTASGIFGQAVAPPAKVYRLSNPADASGQSVAWRVAQVEPAVPWLLIEGGTEATGILTDGANTQVLIEIDSASPALLEGINVATLEFTGTIDDVVIALTTREVLVSLVVSTLDPELSQVPGGDEQPAGPAYDFEMFGTPVTNQEFVAFLNDAYGRPAEARGAYMFFDTTTGDVYVNSGPLGESGSDPGARITQMFAPGIGGHIFFDEGDAPYTAEMDYEDHPVVGVSWYGAVKFANWLTIDQGLGEEQRCYGEGDDSDLTAWNPRSADSATWGARDLNDAERANLVSAYRGYRLPMDDGANNTDPALDAPDGYNEWYKAAAWQGGGGVNVLYGFGRSTIGGADANFADSGDPFDNGTTPVNYYDGTDHEGTFATNANENYFGIADLSGNVYEWMQGRFNMHANSIAFRTLRGGSWNTPSANLRNDVRTFAPPTLTNPEVGFRVLRTRAVQAGDYDGDGAVDLEDWSVFAACMTGPDGGQLPYCAVFDFEPDGDVDLHDADGFARARTP
jgi:formylglycine-generating enzyme required for sulfatase activity